MLLPSRATKEDEVTWPLKISAFTSIRRFRVHQPDSGGQSEDCCMHGIMKVKVKRTYGVSRGWMIYIQDAQRKYSSDGDIMSSYSLSDNRPASIFPQVHMFVPHRPIQTIPLD